MGRKRLKGDAIEDSLIHNFDLTECQKILSKNDSEKYLVFIALGKDFELLLTF